MIGFKDRAILMPLYVKVSKPANHKLHGKDDVFVFRTGGVGFSGGGRDLFFPLSELGFTG
jgi:hypothetical protein